MSRLFLQEVYEELVKFEQTGELFEPTEQVRSGDQVIGALPEYLRPISSAIQRCSQIVTESRPFPEIMQKIEEDIVSGSHEELVKALIRKQMVRELLQWELRLHFGSDCPKGKKILCVCCGWVVVARDPPFQFDEG